MEFLFFIFALILFFLILDLKKSFKRESDKLNYRLDHINAALNKLKSPEGKIEKPVEQVKPLVTPEPVKHQEVIPPAIVERPAPPKPEPQIEKPPIPESQPEVMKVPEVIQPIPTAPIPPKQEEPRPSFFERNPDLEKFIGENLANKIGIAILVLGIGFFVKYAIDQEWIGIYGRVFIGILCGGILIGIAHRLRRKFAAFSSVMVGGGIAVLYLTITIAFHTYGIISQEIAFGIMVLITGFTIILSIAYDRIELAILAILGGFGSPFMVSTGEGNYVILFTYIMILDVGMLVLAFFKKWRPVNIIAYVFTIILFGGWLGARFDEQQPGMIAGAMIFATLFYVTFFVMNVVNNIRKRVAFEALEYLMLLSNTFLYYSAGMYILNNPDGDVYKGLFTAIVAIFNFGFAFALYKNENVDRNLVFLLIGLVLTFLSLAAPIQLQGNHITLFWTAEAVLLLWLSQKSGIKLIKLASLIVMLLMWISLVMDWYNVYVLTGSDSLTGTDPLRVILNKGYLTGAFSVLGIVLYLRLLRNETDYAAQVSNVKTIFSFAAVVILYLSNLFELRHHLEFFVDDPAAGTIIVGLYNVAFIIGLMLAGSRFTAPEALRRAIDALGLVAICSFLIFYHHEIVQSRNNYLLGTASFVGFGIHYLYLILLVVAAVFSLNKIRKWQAFNAETHNAYSWFFVFFFVFLASAELDHTVLLAAGATAETHYHILEQNHKIGYPILWGLASFVIIAAGLRMKLRHLRIISLTLFLITLIKLFFVDIRGISEGGKIAAFISLGILLLIVSFMYQRLKKLLL